jgi:hypothetical protein
MRVLPVYCLKLRAGATVFHSNFFGLSLESQSYGVLNPKVM